ncbi:hypothetical protein Ato02nite_050900 [Paractinoplanes toevensis]|uniref:DUF2690 domain-containing protein n=1 Tax=Paractinoplanes toevensis TaxID=571911 RepID=A0A919TDX2_9ACTN|nr:hypothetical protein Ato02nite_050900 [Actinoplanes toevensis]
MSLVRSLFGRAAAFAVLAIVAIGLSLVPAQASLAASCSGSSCAGRDPQTMGCSSDAVSKGNVYSSDRVTVAMRYSSACDAWWARATCDYPDPTAALYVSFIQFTNGVQTSRQRLAGDHAAACDAGETTWTYMIADRSSGDHYNACWSYSSWGTPATPDESDSCVGRI